MLSSIHIDKIKSGLSYQQFIEKTVTKINSSNEEIVDTEKFEFTKLNIQRSSRIEKTYSPSMEIRAVMAKINSRQTWLVLTEDWCGDSAQNLPYIYKFAQLNNKISLVILERDKNIDLMNNYLTNGTFSIPKLVSFDENMDELFQWGPRPANAALLVARVKSEAKIKEEIMKELHLWYAKDKGRSIEKEFISILNNLLYTESNSNSQELLIHSL